MRLDGFIAHAWTEYRGGRVFLTGRSVDGRSFAAVDDRFLPALYVDEAEFGRAAAIAGTAGLAVREEASGLRTPDGRPVAALRVRDRERKALAAALGSAGVWCWGADERAAEQFLAERGVRAGVAIEGEARPGKRVELVFVDADLEPSAAGEAAPLSWLSLDIETSRRGELRACALAMDPTTAAAAAGVAADGGAADGGATAGGGEARALPRRVAFVVAPSAARADPEASRVAPAGPDAGGPDAGGPPRPVRLPDERALLLAVRDAIVAWDPDIITGWNVVDFDLKVIAERSRALGLAFDAGRSDEPLRILESPGLRTAALLDGRRCVDAMRVMRSAQVRYEDQRLETVARGVLGEGKLLASRGPEKLDELDALYARDPEAYAAYCLRDAELPLAILEKSGMGELTRLRSALTGLDPERAWTSVPAFERVYGLALRARGTLPVPPPAPRVGGAMGGLILDPRPGLFEGVAVFDFRSLYPSIIRTFNIDPCALVRDGAADASPSADAGVPTVGAAAPKPGGPERDAGMILAPNGARFTRERGALPAVVDEWTALRRAALAAGDEPRAYVLKILQNSFYGVLGSPGCAWADDRLSGAITGFGQELLKATRDWFADRGYEVLYGDTDSVFVRLGAAGAPAGGDAPCGGDAAAGTGGIAAAGDGSSTSPDPRARAERLAAEATAALAALAAERWGVESRLELRFEKFYARFLIPRIRGDRAARLRDELRRLGAAELAEGLPEPKGRAKGYAGLLVGPDGSGRVDVKGLEAVRGDWTPLARRFQLELLGLAFGGGTAEARQAAAREYARDVAAELRAGRLDAELEFRRVLKRDLERYAADAPHVKAARLSGASSRGDAVSYIQTAAGPEPPGSSERPPDYAWYLERQLGPIWESVAEAAGWETELSRVAGEQGELF